MHDRISKTEQDGNRYGMGPISNGLCPGLSSTPALLSKRKSRKAAIPENMMPSPTGSLRKPEPAIIQPLVNAGLIDDLEEVSFVPLTGGVSSDIWKVEAKGRIFCVKRALDQLKVEADWAVPVDRNKFEVEWYKIAGRIVPGSAPQILFHDEKAMLFAMDFLNPSDHELWKDKLRAGRADLADAAEVGRRLVGTHAGTAGETSVAVLFPRSDIFRAIRLEPYLEATADKHPDLKAQLFGLSQRTSETKLALIHGDVSPKNILIGPNGPVFLDAECACIGDPAFDLAFCLNHFLLKCLWNKDAQSAYMDCFQAMASVYLAGVTWEDTADLEARAASLLPALFLARVDGKSPVEYVTETADKDKVRRCARELIKNQPSRLDDVLVAWKRELNA